MHSLNINIYNIPSCSCCRGLFSYCYKLLVHNDCIFGWSSTAKQHTLARPGSRSNRPQESEEKDSQQTTARSSESKLIPNCLYI